MTASSNVHGALFTVHAWAFGRPSVFFFLGSKPRHVAGRDTTVLLGRQCPFGLAGIALRHRHKRGSAPRVVHHHPGGTHISRLYAPLIPCRRPRMPACILLLMTADSSVALSAAENRRSFVSRPPLLRPRPTPTACAWCATHGKTLNRNKGPLCPSLSPWPDGSALETPRTVSRALCLGRCVSAVNRWHVRP